MRRFLNETLQTPNPSDYTNTDFKPFVVGRSNPLADKINPSLLKDVDTAAKKANVKVSITTAVSGHDKGSRHEKGLAVDIAMVNGQGFGSEKAAKQKGIYDDIMRFVSELESLGYVKNSESGNDKAVLTFGFPNHHHHVHVSRNSDTGVSDSNGKVSPEVKPDSQETPDSKENYDNIDFDSSSESDNIIQGFLNPMLSSLGFKEGEEPTNKLVEDIQRIKNLL
jgi:hypothetical protein